MQAAHFAHTSINGDRRMGGRFCGSHKDGRPQNGFSKIAYVIQSALEDLQSFVPQFVPISRHLLNHGRMRAPWNEKPGTARCTKCDLRKNACQLRVGGLRTIVEAGGPIAGIFLCCAGTHFNFPYSTDCVVVNAASQPLETQNVYVFTTLLIDLAPVTKFHPGIVVATNGSCRQLGDASDHIAGHPSVRNVLRQRLHTCLGTLCLVAMKPG